MSKAHLVSMVSVCCLLFVFVGCQPTVQISEGSVPSVRVDHPSTDVQYNRVVFLDTYLQNKIEVQRSVAQRTPTNTVEVLVVFRNRTNYTQQLECRVQFFDLNRVPLGEPSAWQRVILQPNEIRTWREASTSANAAYYYVEIREGR